MPKNVTQYSILIASPSDVMNERRIIRQVIHDWNASAGLTQGISLAPVMWETHATPEMGDRPQAIINRQLVDDCDVLIGVFWTRMGSPTGVAVSGTAEEINLFVEAQKLALVYFSSAPINPNEIDIEQYQKLLDFKKASRTKGLFGEFGTPEELRIKLHADLTRTVDKLHKKTSASERHNPNEIKSNMPDIQSKFSVAKDLRTQGAMPSPFVTDVVTVNTLKSIGVQADLGMKLVNAGLMAKDELKASLDTYVNVYFYDPRIYGLDPSRVDLEHTTATINLETGEIG